MKRQRLTKNDKSALSGMVIDSIVRSLDGNYLNTAEANLNVAFKAGLLDEKSFKDWSEIIQAKQAQPSAGFFYATSMTRLVIRH